MALTKILTEGIKDGEIKDVDISTSAAIATSKISGLTTSATTDTTNAANISSGTLPDARYSIELSRDTTPQLGGNLDVNTKNIVFGDSSDGSSDDVLSFGASGDLKIFHQADQSRIVESGPSVLKIMGSDVRLSNAGNTADYIQCNDGADVQLFYNGSKKLSTSANGVLIGATTEGNESADDLTIDNSSNAGITIRSGTSNNGSIFFSDATSGTAEYQGFIQYQHSADNLYFGTSSTSKAVIHSAGQFQIGGTSLSSISSFADDLVLGQSGSTAINGLTFCSTNSSGIRFHDTGDVGEIEFNHSDNSLTVSADGLLKVRTNSAERVRIDSSGIGLGTTPETDGQPSSLYFAGGNANIWGSGNANLYIVVNSRYTGAGGWKYNNNGVASYVGQQSGVWSFHTAASGSADATATFSEKVRMQADGGISFNGDTAAANALDDYEEGTFDAINNYNTVWYSNENKCAYTKIGRVVTVMGQIRQYSGSGNLILGLPYTVASGTESEFCCVGTLGVYDQDTNSSSVGINVLANPGDSFCYFMENIDNAAWAHLQTDASAYLRFTFTYFTT